MYSFKSILFALLLGDCGDEGLEREAVQLVRNGNATNVQSISVRQDGRLHDYWLSINSAAPEHSQEDQCLSSCFRFLGYLEGSKGCPIPASWENSFRTAMSNSTEFEIPYGSYIRGDDGIRWSDNCTIEWEDGDLVLSIDGCSVTFERHWLDENVGWMESITATRKGNRIYVGFHMSRSTSFNLYAIEHQEQTIDWVTEIHAGGSDRILGGLGYHNVNVVQARNEILVFGASDDYLYIESLKVEDGALIERWRIPSR